MTNNGMASLLKKFAYIYMGLSAILGLTVATSDTYRDLGSLQLIVGLSIFGQSLFIGFLFLGISEVINLLSQKNVEVTKKLNEISSEIYYTGSKLNQTPLADVQGELEQHFNKRGMTIQYIKQTSQQNVYYVKTANGVKYVRFELGLSPVILDEEEVKSIS